MLTKDNIKDELKPALTEINEGFKEERTALGLIQNNPFNQANELNVIKADNKVMEGKLALAGKDDGLAKGLAQDIAGMYPPIKEQLESAKAAEQSLEEQFAGKDLTKTVQVIEIDDQGQAHRVEKKYQQLKDEEKTALKDRENYLQKGIDFAEAHGATLPAPAKEGDERPAPADEDKKHNAQKQGYQDALDALNDPNGPDVAKIISLLMEALQGHHPDAPGKDAPAKTEPGRNTNGNGNDDKDGKGNDTTTLSATEEAKKVFKDGKLDLDELKEIETKFGSEKDFMRKLREEIEDNKDMNPAQRDQALKTLDDALKDNRTLDKDDVAKLGTALGASDQKAEAGKGFDFMKTLDDGIKTVEGFVTSTLGLGDKHEQGKDSLNVDDYIKLKNREQHALTGADLTDDQVKTLKEDLAKQLGDKDGKIENITNTPDNQNKLKGIIDGLEPTVGKMEAARSNFESAAEALNGRAHNATEVGKQLDDVNAKMASLSSGYTDVTKAMTEQQKVDLLTNMGGENVNLQTMTNMLDQYRAVKQAQYEHEALAAGKEPNAGDINVKVNNDIAKTFNLKIDDDGHLSLPADGKGAAAAVDAARSQGIAEMSNEHYKEVELASLKNAMEKVSQKSADLLKSDDFKDIKDPQELLAKLKEKDPEELDAIKKEAHTVRTQAMFDAARDGLGVIDPNDPKSAAKLTEVMSRSSQILDDNTKAVDDFRLTAAKNIAQQHGLDESTAMNVQQVKDALTASGMKSEDIDKKIQTEVTSLEAHTKYQGLVKATDKDSDKMLVGLQEQTNAIGTETDPNSQRGKLADNTEARKDDLDRIKENIKQHDLAVGGTKTDDVIEKEAKTALTKLERDGSLIDKPTDTADIVANKTAVDANTIAVTKMNTDLAGLVGADNAKEIMQGELGGKLNLPSDKLGDTKAVGDNNIAVGQRDEAITNNLAKLKEQLELRKFDENGHEYTKEEIQNALTKQAEKLKDMDATKINDLSVQIKDTTTQLEINQHSQASYLEQQYGKPVTDHDVAVEAAKRASAAMGATDYTDKAKLGADTNKALDDSTKDLNGIPPNEKGKTQLLGEYKEQLDTAIQLKIYADAAKHEKDDHDAGKPERPAEDYVKDATAKWRKVEDSIMQRNGDALYNGTMTEKDIAQLTDDLKKKLTEDKSVDIVQHKQTEVPVPGTTVPVLIDQTVQMTGKEALQEHKQDIAEEGKARELIRQDQANNKEGAEKDIKNSREDIETQGDKIAALVKGIKVAGIGTTPSDADFNKQFETGEVPDSFKQGTVAGGQKQQVNGPKGP